MHRLSVMAGIFGAALLMSSAAFAQVPADPNNPNEAVPDTMTLPPTARQLASRPQRRRPRAQLRKP